MTAAALRFQSTPPVKAATYCTSQPVAIVDISIHAAREGGDAVFLPPLLSHAIFQSTPPVKAATQKYPQSLHRKGFQSTPPVKAATHFISSYDGEEHISIHAAREGGDSAELAEKIRTAISIHAAREGGDHFCHNFDRIGHYFNPRRP